MSSMLLSEYCCPLWTRSSYTSLIDTQLHSSMRLISGCLHSTPVSWLLVLSNVSSPSLCRKAASDKMLQIIEAHPNWPVYADMFYHQSSKRQDASDHWSPSKLTCLCWYVLPSTSLASDKMLQIIEAHPNWPVYADMFYHQSSKWQDASDHWSPSKLTCLCWYVLPSKQQATRCFRSLKPIQTDLFMLICYTIHLLGKRQDASDHWSSPKLTCLCWYVLPSKQQATRCFRSLKPTQTDLFMLICSTVKAASDKMLQIIEAHPNWPWQATRCFRSLKPTQTDLFMLICLNIHLLGLPPDA